LKYFCPVLEVAEMSLVFRMVGFLVGVSVVLAALAVGFGEAGAALFLVIVVVCPDQHRSPFYSFSFQ
jgi:hypothetical protein